jgi:hypothetical protein
MVSKLLLKILIKILFIFFDQIRDPRSNHLFELIKKTVSILGNRLLNEFLFNLILNLKTNFSKSHRVNSSITLNAFLNPFVEFIKKLFNSFLASFLNNVSPGVLNTRDRVIINSLDKLLKQSDQHGTIKRNPIDLLALSVPKDLIPQVFGLVLKLYSNVLIVQILKVSIIGLFNARPYHRNAVSLGKETFDHFSDFILLPLGLRKV